MWHGCEITPADITEMFHVACQLVSVMTTITFFATRVTYAQQENKQTHIQVNLSQCVTQLQRQVTFLLGPEDNTCTSTCPMRNSRGMMKEQTSHLYAPVHPRACCSGHRSTSASRCTACIHSSKHRCPASWQTATPHITTKAPLDIIPIIPFRFH